MQPDANPEEGARIPEPMKGTDEIAPAPQQQGAASGQARQVARASESDGQTTWRAIHQAVAAAYERAAEELEMQAGLDDSERAVVRRCAATIRNLTVIEGARIPRELPADMLQRLRALAAFGEGSMYFQQAYADAVLAALRALGELI